MTLVIALALLVMLRYVARTPFGLALQGIRDDPQRMRSLGYSVALHRTVAFALAGFVAAVSGILFVWWNGQISPSAIGLPATINILVIAVIGGLYRVEAAFLGALVFVVLNNYARQHRLHRGALQHVDRDRLPGHRGRVARRSHRPVGTGAAPMETRFPHPVRRGRGRRAGPAGGAQRVVAQ